MTLFKDKKIANKEIELTQLDKLTPLLEEFARVNK